MKPAKSISISLLLSLFAVGCDETQHPSGVADRSSPSGFAVVAAASAPTPVPIFIQFDDLNPCSGLVHTVTFTGTAWIQELDGRVVIREQRTITTSSGFEGRGTDTFVDNGNIQTFRLDDMLTNESGDRIRAHGLMVFDLSTLTVHVEKFAVTCVGR